MNSRVLNHLLHSGNLKRPLLTAKVSLAEIIIKTVVENLTVHNSTSQVEFFFTILLFEKCLLNIEIARSYLNNVNTIEMTDELNISTVG